LFLAIYPKAQGVLQRLPKRKFEDLLGPRCKGWASRWLANCDPDDVFDLTASPVRRDSKAREDSSSNPLLLVDQAEKKVLRPDVVVIEKTGLLLGEYQHSSSSVRESFEHGRRLQVAALPRFR
jgi:hypothetical protein